MQALSFYLFYPFIYVIASSPFWLLYKISDILFLLVFHLLGYRKKVVWDNLRKSFPKKTEKEIKNIRREFYRYLCDLIMETFKTITWNEKQARSRVRMHNTELLDSFYEKGQSIIIVMGHLGNWEWAGPCFSLYCKHQLFVVYYPLTNPYFEKVLKRSRTKFNTKIVQRKDTLRSMIANKKTISATALIADQAPRPVNTAVWMEFLNQDTAVFNGPEKIAKMMGYPVVYMNVNRVRRGYYEVTPTTLFEQPKETEDNEITKVFNNLLAQDIMKKPETWLWSHRRWKNKRVIS